MPDGAHLAVDISSDIQSSGSIGESESGGGIEGGNGTASGSARKAMVLWDFQNCIPLDKIPPGEKPILLLTPVVNLPVDQDPRDDRDPFEILGQTLAGRDLPVRHVPYTKIQGVTGVHVAFIKRARAVILVITGFPDPGRVSNTELAGVVAEICEFRPLIVIACGDVSKQVLQAASHRTVIQTTTYSNADLQATLFLLLDGKALHIDPEWGRLGAEPAWLVQPWNVDRDLVEIHGLWISCLPQKFHASLITLRSLLHRDGYALHYVVREPSRKALVGFCATYTTFAGGCGDDLIGSIAAIMVQKRFRGQGLGLMLHDTATSKLRKIRGVGRIQLGTTFPRLLCGIPLEGFPTRWFEKRGWPVDGSGPGRGRLAADWVLRFSDLPNMHLASAGLSFRHCDESVAQRVLDMVSSHCSPRNPCFGWYDQYARAMNSGNIGDIIVGFEGTTIVAVAITYCPGHEGPAAADIPWPGTLGSDIGGVTCICIKDDPEMVSRRDTVMVRLLHACCKTLGDRGMAGMFLDAVRSVDHGLGSLGFRKWADYREIWKSVQHVKE